MQGVNARVVQEELRLFAAGIGIWVCPKGIRCVCSACREASYVSRPIGRALNACRSVCIIIAFLPFRPSNAPPPPVSPPPLNTPSIPYCPPYLPQSYTSLTHQLSHTHFLQPSSSPSFLPTLVFTTRNANFLPQITSNLFSFLSSILVMIAQPRPIDLKFPPPSPQSVDQYLPPPPTLQLPPTLSIPSDDVDEDPVPISNLMPSVRHPDRLRPTSYSLKFEGALTRRKSLFVPRPRTAIVTATASSTSIWGANSSSKVRRSASFHRYARIEGHQKPKRWNIDVFGDDIDDLTESIGATQVEEYPISHPMPIANPQLPPRPHSSPVPSNL